ncbi:alpha/beta hydrolase [Methylobacterium terricola]|uniref:Alpha/beta hydrolase n=1 Tax=Methylobacterium terricola TaxID=2583531 RepID=A0A5C4LPT8_9HYPH|nr:lipase family protein [Methylobacterium terricola]TNC16250.1 alpha/beta hydrolase [Methylobacterium terricola]
MKMLLMSIALATTPLCATPAAAQTTPATLETMPPGQMLETAPLSPELGLPEAERALSIIYTSTDGMTGHGTIPVSGAIFLPKGPPPEGGWPVVAWAHGTVGIADRCAPSRNPRSARDKAYLDQWLSQGYAVVATDYQGLGTPGPHPYLQSRSAAYSVLDSVRAALGAKLGLADRVLIVGQSQGAGAAFASAGEASDYAPSLNVVGTVATGIPYFSGASSGAGNLDEVDRTIAYLFYIAAAAQATDPSIDAKSLFTAKGAPLLEKAEQICVVDLMKAVVDAGLTRRNSIDPQYPVKLAKYLRGGTYRTLALKAPVFVGTGDKDVDVPVAMQQKLVRDACAAGTRIAHHVYAGLDHSGAVNPSFADSSKFAAAVTAGKPVASTCPN